MNDKTIRPPYTSYRSFESLIEELREHKEQGVMPDVIDRSLLARRSGSEQSALFATLRWFNLIDEQHAPTTRLGDFLDASEEAAKTYFKELIEDSYSFVTDGSFNLKSATSKQMEAKFREYEISGSTLVKAIAFFLNAAKSAGISVSPHVKAPSTAGNGNSKKKSAKPQPQLDVAPPPSPEEKPLTPKAGMIHITIPIMGMPDGSIHLPENMNARQWTKVIQVAEFLLKNYRGTMADDDQGEDEL
ncbi:TPA: DUF5343 domain-containing protein [Pseudomonas aeruginosa]|uniref:DUF5343 domain-containing protein n=1 Tax=Pseudomonas aeruginosa TaxID=287 RepID=UPI0019D4E760|nr:DUF5343 domain-containing protein [Pseudomonas aeruginosa]MBN7870530.1 DUF5343 domain-containing protein [Pseudomonas aeruginosa]HBO4338428.1 DUF5343 domain-containing protein [Pseudomonas aeruginosa]HCF4603945.1 DUF5343 domain-containing protein [Pseudomonas aeruginosa]